MDDSDTGTLKRLAASISHFKFHWGSKDSSDLCYGLSKWRKWATSRSAFIEPSGWAATRFFLSVKVSVDQWTRDSYLWSCARTKILEQFIRLIIRPIYLNNYSISGIASISRFSNIRSNSNSKLEPYSNKRINDGVTQSILICATHPASTELFYKVEYSFEFEHR